MLQSLIIVVVIILLLMWLIDQLPFDYKIKMITRVAVIGFILIWLLQILVGYRIIPFEPTTFP